MIRIQQVKTDVYTKPVSGELALLLEKAIEYAKSRHGDTEYIFVNEKDISRPLQYTTIKNKILQMILDDAIQQQAGIVNPRRKILDQAMDSRIEQLQNQLAQLQRENDELKKENAKLHKALSRKNLNLIKSL